MIKRMRMLLSLARPAVVLLLVLFTVTGLGEAGQGENRALLARALVVVIAYLLCSVAINDLSDESIDRVNLPGDHRRPLVAGTASRRDLVVVAVASAAIALVASATIGWPALAVAAGGLAVSAAYSLRPVRLADRGAAACLVLPAGYVAVPYLVGVLSGRGAVNARDLLLLGGLYAGFIGRIALKDFRDLRGDALFGKRTFLIRHGRRRTCELSAACWVAGMLTLASVRDPSMALVAAWAVYLVVALWLLRALSVDHGRRRDDALISAIAVVGRAVIVSLIAHFSTTGAGWSASARLALMTLLVAVTLAQAGKMLRRAHPASEAVGAVTPRQTLPVGRGLHCWR
jgi:4-hydroxybenzoate polyprenyltransferase